ncbi:MAG: phage virion morphogenesis protein [Bacteroidales bacterium]|nr:phage virion morphogenesis protein [Bacteroidales bacterium]
MKTDFFDKIDRFSKAIKTLPGKMGAEAVLFSKERFRSQNWVDNRTHVWAKRKTVRGSKQRQKRGVLIDSGRLMRSIRKIYVSNQVIIIGTDVPYAQVHNEGFKGTVSVKAHKRGTYSKTKKGTGVYSIRSRTERTRTVREKTGSIKVKAHTKKLNIPQRQFLGNSDVLAKRIERMALANMNKAFK